LSTATAAPAADASAGGASYGTPGYRLYVLIMLTLVYTINFVDRNLLNVIGQPIIKEFNLDDTTYGFLNGPPFAIFYAFMGIPIAMAADRMNRVVIMALCISIWSVMAAMCGLATSFVFLLAARIGVAIGEAGGTPPSNSLIGDYFKPTSRANALGVFSMGVTIGSALSNYFGGPIAANLNGPTLKKWFTDWGWDWAVNLTNWDAVEGWRVAFIVIGAPGVVVALLLLFTVKEPPRGASDPPGTKRVERASMLDTLKELGPKPTFWNMAIAASLTALVGYGLTSLQAPMAQRIHEIPPGQFAWEFGGPLALWSAAGTFAGGFLIDRVSSRVQPAVAIVPALGLLLAIPLYIFAWNVMPDATAGPPAQDSAVYTFARPLWCAGAFCHYMYLGSQYTIGQGVVGARGRASAIAILLLMIALIGNGLGPLITGWLSDMFMQNLVNADPQSAGLLASDCRIVINGRPGFTPNYEQVAAALSDVQKTICATNYGEGARQSMIYTSLIFIPAAVFFLLSSLTLKKDMIAKTH
jgi:MFS family permease